MNNEAIIDSIAKPSFIKSVYYSSGVLLKPKDRMNSSLSQKDLFIMRKQKQKHNSFKSKVESKQSPTQQNSLEELSRLWGIYPRAVQYAFPEYACNKGHNAGKRQMKRKISEKVSLVIKNIIEINKENDYIKEGMNKSNYAQGKNINVFASTKNVNKRLLFRPISTHSQSQTQSKSQIQSLNQSNNNNNSNMNSNKLNPHKTILIRKENKDKKKDLSDNPIDDDKDKLFINEDEFNKYSMSGNNGVNNDNAYNSSTNLNPITNTNTNTTIIKKGMTILPKTVHLSSPSLINKMTPQDKSNQNNKSQSQYAFPIQSNKGKSKQETYEIKNYKEQCQNIIKYLSTNSQEKNRHHNNNNNDTVNANNPNNPDYKRIMRYSLSQKAMRKKEYDTNKVNINKPYPKCITIFDNLTLKSAIDNNATNQHKESKSRSAMNLNAKSSSTSSIFTKASNTASPLFNLSLNHKVNTPSLKSPKDNNTHIDIELTNTVKWRKHEEIWSNIRELNKKASDLKKYLIPPNDNDIIISSYLTLYPESLNRLKDNNDKDVNDYDKLNQSLNAQAKVNRIHFTLNESLGDPKYEVIKWKNVFSNVLSRWSIENLSGIMLGFKLKKKNKHIDLKKMIDVIIFKANRRYKDIMKVLRNIIQKKYISESISHQTTIGQQQ